MPYRDKQPARSALTCLKRAAAGTLGGGFLAAVLLLGYYLWLVRGALLSHPLARPTNPDLRRQDLSARRGEDEDLLIYQRRDLPGISTPPVRTAAEAGVVEDDDEIIGVRVGGRSRAYFLGALRFPRHVINDMVGGQAVSVTYCDVARRARVFTDSSAKAPLQLDIAGQLKGGLLLRVGNVEYAQKTGENRTSPNGAPLPYKDVTFVRTTWRDWREAHPDTDIYVGDFRPQTGAPSGAAGE
ncbi:MAG: DUF3179 domain-containing (seleno)protein [Gemmataceae bacterium]